LEKRGGTKDCQAEVNLRDLDGRYLPGRRPEAQGREEEAARSDSARNPGRRRAGPPIRADLGRGGGVGRSDRSAG
jgi:hypothetical protein